MRATEVFQLLEKAEFHKLPEAVPGNQQLRRLNEFRARWRFVRPIPGFQDVIEKLEDSVIFRSSKDSLNVPDDEWQAIYHQIHSLVSSLRGLHKYLGSIVQTETPLSVFVKIPDQADIPATAALMQRISQTLSLAVLDPSIGGKVELRSWEKGSFWFEVFVGTALAAKVVGALAWAGAVVFKKIQEAKLMSENVRSLELRNEHVEALVDAQRKQLAVLVETEARAIYADFYEKKPDPEQIGRLRHAIKEVADLVAAGTEVHPSLTAPEDVKNLYPDFGKIPILGSRTRMITEGATPSSEPSPGATSSSEPSPGAAEQAHSG